MTIDKSGDKEWEEFRARFYKFMWKIFILAKVPIILVWLALLIGIIIGSLGR